MSAAVPKKHLFGRRWIPGPEGMMALLPAVQGGQQTSAARDDVTCSQRFISDPGELQMSYLAPVPPPAESPAPAVYVSHSDSWQSSPVQSVQSAEVDEEIDVDGTDDMPASAELLVKDPPLVCQVCGKEFPIAARLLRHMRVHSGEKPFNCDFCGKTFSVKENLNVHRRIHTKERPYRCEVCGRAFEHSGKLNRHLRIHTGERPHKCTLCDKAFVQSGQLVIHMRAHTGEKPYGCETCGKAFTCSKQLKVHRRTHTGEKPYTCNICGKSFGYNHVLKTHKNSHFGQRMYKCTLCNTTFSQRKLLEHHLAIHKAPGKTLSPAAMMVDQSSVAGSTQEQRMEYSPPLLTQPTIAAMPTSTGTNMFMPASSITPSVSAMSAYLHQEPMPVPHWYSPIQHSAFFPRNHTLVAPYPLRYCWLPSAGAMSTAPLLPPVSITPISVSPTGAFQPRRPSHSPATIVSSPSPALQQDYLSVASQSPADSVQLTADSELTSKVAFILSHIITAEGLRKLGYPQRNIGDALQTALQDFGEEPCGHGHAAELERLKCNMRTLLLWCVPDQQLWFHYGWKNKSIEDIIEQFYEECSREVVSRNSEPEDVDNCQLVVDGVEVIENNHSFLKTTADSCMSHN